MQFNAAHRVHNPALSDEENRALFGKCNNPNWHGHNYTLDVFVEGPIEDKTGYVMDLKKLRELVNREVVNLVDHKNFNFIVPLIRGRIATSENIVVGFRVILHPAK